MMRAKTVSGQLTVYVSLAFLLVMSFLLSGLESARSRAAEAYFQMEADTQGSNLFSYYYRPLFDDYRLLFLASQSPGGESAETTASRLLLTAMEEQTGETFWPVDVLAVTPEDVVHGADFEGRAVEKEILDYMKYRSVPWILEELIPALRQMQEGENLREAVPENLELPQGESPSQQEESPQVSARDQAEALHFLEQANTFRRSGILGQVLSDTDELSGNGWTKEERDPESVQGNWDEGECLFEADGGVPKAEALMTAAYFSDVLTSYTSPGRGTAAYEQEYLIGGEDSDAENLKCAVRRLVIIREGLNLTALYTMDSSRRAEASALAATISMIPGLEPWEPVIELFILGVWAYAEALQDVRDLLAGGKVPLVKTAAEWRIEFAQMFSRKPVKTDGRGFSYENYLMLLLLIRGSKDNVRRFMELTEIQFKTADTDFRWENTIYKVDFAIDAQAPGIWRGAQQTMYALVHREY